VKHSKTLTDNGKAWARAVNPLHKARSAWDSWTKEDRETERKAWKTLANATTRDELDRPKRVSRSIVRLPNPAKTLADLPAGAQIRLFQEGGILEVYIHADRQLAYLRAYSDASTSDYEITDSDAEHGWGPLAYDILMERATELGMSLCGGYASREARAVWQKYLDRPDVTATYDPLRQPFVDDDNDDAVLPDVAGKCTFRKQPKLLHDLATMRNVKYMGDWSRSKQARTTSRR
jgi:hypothetical protein